jgi:hypothetical protein
MLGDVRYVNEYLHIWYPIPTKKPWGFFARCSNSDYLFTIDHKAGYHQSMWTSVDQLRPFCSLSRSM